MEKLGNNGPTPATGLREAVARLLYADYASEFAGGDISDFYSQADRILALLPSAPEGTAPAPAAPGDDAGTSQKWAKAYQDEFRAHNETRKLVRGYGAATGSPGEPQPWLLESVKNLADLVDECAASGEFAPIDKRTTEKVREHLERFSTGQEAPGEPPAAPSLGIAYDGAPMDLAWFVRSLAPIAKPLDKNETGIARLIALQTFILHLKSRIL